MADVSVNIKVATLNIHMFHEANGAAIARFIGQARLDFDVLCLNEASASQESHKGHREKSVQVIASMLGLPFIAWGQCSHCGNCILSRHPIVYSTKLRIRD